MIDVTVNDIEKLVASKIVRFKTDTGYVRANFLGFVANKADVDCISSLSWLIGKFVFEDPKYNTETGDRELYLGAVQHLINFR